MKKKLVSILLILIMALSLTTGCTGEKAGEPEGGQKKTTGVTNNEQQETVNKGEEDVIGQFIGQVDPHSVEIEINGEPRVFQTTQLKQDISTFDTKEWVKISYIKSENGELILKSIEKK